MIIETTGDILAHDCEAFVCPVNCKGVMGKGLALEVKNRFPVVYKNYKAFCDGACPDFAERLKPGYCIAIAYASPQKICICVATKDDWRNPSTLEWIREGLEQINQTCKCLNLKSVAIPKIGCGCGGLDWSVVKPLIIDKFKDSEVTVKLYN